MEIGDADAETQNATKTLDLSLKKNLFQRDPRKTAPPGPDHRLSGKWTLFAPGMGT